MQKKIELRTKIIRVRLTEREYEQIQKYTEQSGLTCAEFIRRASTRRRIISRVDVNLINELRKQGGLLKMIHLETRAAYSEKTAAAIIAIRDTIRAISKATAECNDR